MELLDQAHRSTEQLAAPILAVAKKTGHLRTLGHPLFAYMHTAQGGAAEETPPRRGGDSRMLIEQGPGQARGAPFGPRREARLSASARLGQPGTRPERRRKAASRNNIPEQDDVP